MVIHQVDAVRRNDMNGLATFHDVWVHHRVQEILGIVRFHSVDVGSTVLSDGSVGRTLLVVERAFVLRVLTTVAHLESSWGCKVGVFLAGGVGGPWI